MNDALINLRTIESSIDAEAQDLAARKLAINSESAAIRATPPGIINGSHRRRCRLHAEAKLELSRLELNHAQRKIAALVPAMIEPDGMVEQRTKEWETAKATVIDGLTTLGFKDVSARGIWEHKWREIVFAHPHVSECWSRVTMAQSSRGSQQAKADAIRQQAQRDIARLESLLKNAVSAEMVGAA